MNLSFTYLPTKSVLSIGLATYLPTYISYYLSSAFLYIPTLVHRTIFLSPFTSTYVHYLLLGFYNILYILLYCVCSEGLSSSEKEYYDFIMIDYQMPKMDGPTAIAAIRAMGYRGAILGLTGNVVAVDQEAMVQAGADSVLTKPLVDVDLLWKAVDLKIGKQG